MHSFWGFPLFVTQGCWWQIPLNFPRTFSWSQVSPIVFTIVKQFGNKIIVPLYEALSFVTWIEIEVTICIWNSGLDTKQKLLFMLLSNKLPGQIHNSSFHIRLVNTSHKFPKNPVHFCYLIFEPFLLLRITFTFINVILKLHIYQMLRSQTVIQSIDHLWIFHCCHPQWYRIALDNFNYCFPKLGRAFLGFFLCLLPDRYVFAECRLFKFLRLFNFLFLFCLFCLLCPFYLDRWCSISYLLESTKNLSVALSQTSNPNNFPHAHHTKSFQKTVRAVSN